MNEDFCYLLNTKFVVLLNLTATLDGFDLKKSRFTYNLARTRRHPRRFYWQESSTSCLRLSFMELKMK